MATPGESAAPPSAAAAQQSEWHSPVPYLFGGLAAMLGLIAFAVLLLACSYWKLTGNLENPDERERRDIEAGEADGGAKPAPQVVEDKYLVIMAGQEKPTFLATPASSRASSFRSKCSATASENTPPLEEDCEEQRVESGGNVQIEMGNN